MTSSKPDTGTRTVIIALLLITLTGAGAVIYLVTGQEEKTREVTAPASLPPAPAIERAPAVEETAPPPVVEESSAEEIIDAIENPDAAAVEGQRYKVLVMDESRREGNAGVTRIGGLLTFVPDSRPGDVAIIEVTRLKRSTAESSLIETLETGRPVPGRAGVESADEADSRIDGMVGQVHQATIEAIGREGDGIAKVDGKVVFVAGASLGEQVEFRIVEDVGRFARGELTTGASAVATEQKREEATSADGAQPYIPVQPGEEYEVVISEVDRRNPAVNGVARINNYIVFVPESKVDDRVRIRIVRANSRAADAEVIENLGPAAP